MSFHGESPRAAEERGPEAPRLAVWDGPARLEPEGPVWERLRERVRRAAPDVLLMNEMPFGRWVAGDPNPDPDALAASREAHDRGLQRLGELGVPLVLGSRPTLDERGRSVNEAFAWTADDGPVAVHTKQFFPEEEGYWEVRWFRRGELKFGALPVRVGERSLRVAFLICTDVWFNEWARRYGREGVDLIAVPRATPAGSADRWKTAVRMAALVSGCWVASANRVGAEPETGQRFGGGGWIVDPDGRVVAETSSDAPVATADLDLGQGIRAKLEYPRYVDELPPAAE